MAKAVTLINTFPVLSSTCHSLRNRSYKVLNSAHVDMELDIRFVIHESKQILMSFIWLMVTVTIGSKRKKKTGNQFGISGRKDTSKGRLARLKSAYSVNDKII